MYYKKNYWLLHDFIKKTCSRQANNFSTIKEISRPLRNIKILNIFTTTLY